MAWLMEKNYHIRGPNFQVIANPGGTKLINNIGVGSFLPWCPSQAPAVARQDKAYRGKLDDITIVGGSVAVSRRFRDLVEDFEPDIHAFAPLVLERKNGVRFEGEYFLFSAQQDIDCLITNNEADAFEYIGEFAGERRIRCRLTDPGHEIPISAPAISGKHLWTAGLLSLNQMFVSDEFADAARRSLRGRVRIDRRCTTVDRPWIAEEQMGPLLTRHEAYVASGRTVVDYTLGEI